MGSPFLFNRKDLKEKSGLERIIKGYFPPIGSGFKYPAELSDSEQIIQQANNISLDRMFLDFRVRWGITDIIAQASTDYKTLAHDQEVQSLSKIKYRNGLREAIYELADGLVES